MTAFPVTVANTNSTFAAFQGQTTQVMSLCTAIQAASQASVAQAIPAQQLLSLLTLSNQVLGAITTMNANTALVTAMLAYLPLVFPSLAGQTTSQVQTLFNAAEAALQALVAAVVKDLPVDSQGFLQVQTLVNSVPTMASFTNSQLTNTLPAITAFLATVE